MFAVFLLPLFSCFFPPFFKILSHPQSVYKLGGHTKQTLKTKQDPSPIQKILTETNYLDSGLAWEMPLAAVVADLSGT